MCGAGAWTLGSGAVLLVSCSILSVYWPNIFLQQLANRMILSPTSLSYDIWHVTPVPMYFKVYMWNMTNGAEVIASNRQIKPHFAQLGPYVFSEIHVKTNLSWHPENGTVSFYNNRTWHYEPQLSNGSLDDPITNVNMVVAAAAYTMRLQSFLVRPLVNAFLQYMHEDMLVTASVREWVFDGIHDPVISWAVENNFDIGIPFDRFGWFYQRNGSESADGSFNMETGAGELSRLGNIAAWNYSPRTPFDGACGDVRGSTGELWPPGQDPDTITVFAADLCTYMELERDSEMEWRGVRGVRFVANESVFDNGHRFPATGCYCERPDTSDCVPSGALNVSVCRFGAPAFVSMPHFYNADPFYLTKVDGLEPSKEEHEFYLSLEPGTGIPLDVRAQLQINIMLRHVPGMSIANALPDDTFVPMFWFRQEVQLTEDYARLARLAVGARVWVLYALYALAGVGAGLVMVGTGLTARALVRSRSQPLLEPPTAAAAAADADPAPEPKP